jgi:hypothetical protein
MFSHTNAALPLFPQQQLCIDITRTFPWTPPCYYIYNSGICAWYPSHHIPCFANTTQTIFEQGPACQPVTGPVPGPLTQGDPIDQLQALRRQLEVAMAGLEAQERVLRAQKDASRAQQDAPHPPGAGPDEK